jgi:CRP/FNR family transcriptional regulator, cyclic AMP receptor protein
MSVQLAYSAQPSPKPSPCQGDRIVASFAALPRGSSLRFVVDYEPRALRARFGELHAGSYIWTQRFLAENLWDVTIRRTGHPPATGGNSEATLACSPVFADLSPAARDALARGAVRRAVPRGTVIIEQGVSWPYFGLVASGSVAAIVSTRTGREYTLFEAVSADVFAVMQALDEGVTGAQYVATSSENCILMLPRPQVIDLARRDGSFALRLATSAAQQTRRIAALLNARVTKPTVARLAAILLPYATHSEHMAPASLPLPFVTQVQLASMVGTVKDVIGRDLAELRAAGALALRAGHIVRIDESRLRAFL